MKERPFLVVSNNKVYHCEDTQELMSKVKALKTFGIAYRVYYLAKDEWTEMLIKLEDFIKSFEQGVADGLKGVSDGSCSKN